jgi:hypothetical protein
MTTEPPGWPTSWPQVNRVVGGLRDGLGDALGDELAGLYLSGSLALGGFDPPSSDIDVLVAPAGMVDEAAVERLAALHAALRAPGGWSARLEVVYLPVTTLRSYDPGDNCSYPIVGSDRALALGRQSPTWVLDRWVAREHGLVVAGPLASTLIHPIGPRALQATAPGAAVELLGRTAGRADAGLATAPQRAGIRDPQHAGPCTAWSMARSFPS